jgi:predicted Fe-Mo cluster-binding NifX family protein
MKVAVSSQGQSVSSDIDPRFGRTSGFVLFDTETLEVSFLDNSDNQSLAQGAGIKTAQALSKAGVQVVLTGQLGPKAAEALNHSNIAVYSCQAGTVQQALENFKQSRLNYLTPEDAQPGPGKMGGRGKGGGGRGRGPSSGGRRG